MTGTKVVIIESKKELDSFIAENDVISIQALIVSGLSQSILRGGGTIMENRLIWNVWYKTPGGEQDASRT